MEKQSREGLQDSSLEEGLEKGEEEIHRNEVMQKGGMEAVYTTGKRSSSFIQPWQKAWLIILYNRNLYE